MEHVLSKLLLLFGLVHYAFGHGMMIEPVGRQSRWRVDDTAPVNTNDNELFCGGITVSQDLIRFFNNVFLLKIVTYI